LQTISEDDLSRACELTESFYLVWGRAENYTQDGILIRLTFRADNDIEAGNYPIQLSYDSLLGYRPPVDENEKVLDIRLSDGLITINNCVPGDANYDREIGPADLVRLARYIAGYGVTICDRAADATGDGEVGPADLVRLARFLAGHDVTISPGSINLHCRH